MRFTPSVVDPHAEYADEIYIPVFGKEDIIEDTIIPVESKFFFVAKIGIFNLRQYRFCKSEGKLCIKFS